MKRNNYFLLIVSLFTFVGCTGEKAPRSLATAYQSKYLIEEDSLVRNVASIDQSKMCFESIFNITTLQKEVADYERKVIGSPVRGSWKHLNLEDLPIAQANFLKKYGDSIGDQANPDSISYEGCSTLTCIFNRVYQRNEYDVAGYVHYLWYLKFGNYLSLDNRVHAQKSQTPGIYNDKQYALSDYLYNNDELYGLWRVMHMLQEPYTSLTNLREVQRIPRNEFLEGFQPAACGLAYSNGYILLNDKCLTTNAYDKKLAALTKNRGFLYIGVIHEMSHMLDYLQAKQRNSRNLKRSEDQDYIDLIGFKKQEYIGENSVLISSWKVEPGTKIIRDYSGTSPVENFADTLAYFRQDGNEAKEKITSAQFQWTSTNYFHGEKYDDLGIGDLLLKKYGTKFSKDILTKVTNCFSNQKDFNSKYFARSDFSESKMSSRMFNCISFEAEAISKRLTAHIQTYDPDGCGATLPSKNQVNLWVSTVKESLKKQFAIYIDEINNDPTYLAKVINFKLTLKDRTMANEAIFECYKGSTLDDLSSCYELKALEKAKHSANQLHFPEEQAQEMGNLYLSGHPYKNVIQDLYLSYRNILNAHDSLIIKESEELWQMCLSSPYSDDLKPSGNLFYPRMGYLISSIYNCLNTNLPITFKKVVSAVSFDDQKINHPVEEQIIIEFLAPRINERLHEIHETSMTEESVLIATHFAELSDQIRNKLLADFSWVKSLNGSEIDKSCKIKALEQIAFLPLFHLKRDAFTDLIIGGPCKDIMLEPTFKNFLDKSKKEVETNIFSQVETILEVNIENRAISCLGTIPWKWERTKSTVRLPRKTCLKLGKEQIEIDTLAELMKIPLIRRFGISEYELKLKISESYESVRLRLEEKHF